MQASIIGPDGKDMILIPAGPFLMGSDEYGPETPPHKVTLDAFYIDKYPVTNAEYKRFVDATGHKLPQHWQDHQCPEGRADHPVYMLNWYDAQAYAAWAGKRLATEAEWEKAARGTDGRRWPWGDAFDESKTVVWENAMIQGLTTVPVTQYPEGASPFGVCQMAGQVEEWVDDWYQPYPGSLYRSQCYGQEYKVLRGGSWFYTQQYARCAYRRCARPDAMGFADCDGPGFRCVMDVQASGG
jgi:formylglycine-generating enzyme required for sulfatase activity